MKEYRYSNHTVEEIRVADKQSASIVQGSILKRLLLLRVGVLIVSCRNALRRGT